MDIFHDSHHTFFRDPFGAVTCGDWVTVRLGVRTEAPVRAWIRLWQEDHEERILMEPVRVRAAGAMGEADTATDIKTPVFWEGVFQAPERAGLVWYYFIVEELDREQWALCDVRCTRYNGQGEKGEKGEKGERYHGHRIRDNENDEWWRSCGGVRYYYGDNWRRLGGAGTLAGMARCGSFGGGDDVAEPPAYQVTVSSRDNQVPKWYKQGIMYQIFVDRFHQGAGVRWEHVAVGRQALFHRDWNDKPFYIRNEEGGIDRWIFFGGNLDGIRMKLRYLLSLGVTILYLNPIFEAASNHKYDTADYHKVDPLFGDEEILRALVEEARGCGISIILDGVFSHTGADSRYFNRRGLYPEVGAHQSVESPYASWYQFERFPDVYSSWWGIKDLPNVNEMEPSYIDFICQGQGSVIRSWMRCGIRGWRLDVADELPEAFIRHVREAMSGEDDEAVLIGEVWEDASHKVSYGEMRRYFAGDELHGTMNYPFRAFLLDFMIFRVSAYDLWAGVMSLYENYPRENFRAAMNLLGSHDVARILTLLGDAPEEKGLSDEKKREFVLPAGTRNVAVQRLNMLVLWQMAFPGVPHIYYGDEAGMEGFRDPYNRGPYPWGQEDQVILDMYRRWTALRREYDLLRDGEMWPVCAGVDVCGFWRVWPGSQGGQEAQEGKETSFWERILLLVNRSEAVCYYEIGGCEEEIGDSWPQPCWERPLFWGESEQWEVVDLDSGCRERVETLGEPPETGGGSYCVEVPALSARVLLFRPVRDVVNPAWMERAAGVLLPVAALPSRYEIGDFGFGAYEFVDRLVEVGQKVWQILPLNPLDQVNSPYQSGSSMTISPLYISPEKLRDLLRGCLADEDLSDWERAWIGEPVSGELVSEESEKEQEIEGRTIDYERAGYRKTGMLRGAFALLSQLEMWTEKGGALRRAWEEFRRENASWVEEYSLFCALKAEQKGRAWSQWEEALLRDRDEGALDAARQRLRSEMEYYVFEQFIAEGQFQELHEYAKRRGLSIMGDMPFYVAADSVDCWAHQEMFWLKEGRPTVVAGVPPDYFSEDGQRWGNPVYRWDVMARDGYSWWRARLGRAFDLFDCVRLDHFRAFAGYWEIPAEKETAREGLWMKGPGRHFFETLEREWGPMPIVAEDLGFLTPEVTILRNMHGIPGMKVLQFQDGNLDVDEDVVFFSGTHDNDTLWGHVEAVYDNDQGMEAVGKGQVCIAQICRELMEKLYRSRAGLVILPVQDILLLDSRARTNVPGTMGGNWEWRMCEEDLADPGWDWLKGMDRRTRLLD
ncbi:MAG: 4-alpha-glucanotransferase [Peptococcaceae bacterium]|nr:4-alpha-glucanotransferase [Peptococcaceae bacterium]